MGVYVDNARSVLSSFHDEAKTDGVRLGHVGPHDEHAIAKLKVFLEGCGGSSAERGAQTGHRGAVSYARLVLDLDDAERRAELLDQVVLFVVEGRAAEARDPHRALRRIAVRRLLLPGLLARADDPLDDHVHRLV